MVRPLYHGTSTLWLDSIKRFGLGGVFPFHDRALELLTQWQRFADDHLGDDDQWIVQRPGVLKMATQESSHLNWQHGQVYLSLSFTCAAGYAKNRLGSELLTECARIYEISLSNSAVSKTFKKLIPDWFTGLVQTDARPLVISVQGLAMDRLTDEQGGDPRESLSLVESERSRLSNEYDEIERARSEIRNAEGDEIVNHSLKFRLILDNQGVTRTDYVSDMMEALVQQQNFRLIGYPISFDQLKLHDVA